MDTAVALLNDFKHVGEQQDDGGFRATKMRPRDAMRLYELLQDEESQRDRVHSAPEDEARRRAFNAGRVPAEKAESAPTAKADTSKAELKKLLAERRAAAADDPAERRREAIAKASAALTKGSGKAAEAFNEGAAGLVELFGLKDGIQSGVPVNISPETYARAKPRLDKMWIAAKESGTELGAFVDATVEMLGAVMDEVTARALFERWVDDDDTGSPTAAIEAVTPEPPPPGGGPASTITEFRPDELLIDAHRFQFKSGGDAEGVTERLQGLKKWNPIHSGAILVWQDTEGRNYVIDGHQRSGLARRLFETDPSIRLVGRVLREADGVTDVDARVIAAVKNIAEGSATAVDAAKVLRDVGEEAVVDLPPQSAVVRDARGLVALGEMAFSMAAQEATDPVYASLVGKMVPRQADGAPDDALQVGIIQTLAKYRPSTQTEAASMIQDSLAATGERAETENLFGSIETATPLIAERARVLDWSLSRLRRDKKLFRSLNERASDIQAAGNVLATEKNTERQTTDAETLEVIKRTASLSGPVSEALTAAAQSYRDGDALAAAGRAFIARVAETWRGPGGAGRDGRVAPDAQGPDAVAEESADGTEDDGVERVVPLIQEPPGGLFAAEKQPGAGRTAGLGPAKPAARRRGEQLRPSEILQALLQNLDLMPIGRGKIGKLIGAFKPGIRSIRLRTADDVETAYHEIGHALGGEIRRWNGAFMSLPVAAELRELGKETTEKDDSGVLVEEGVAEFVRRWTRGDEDLGELAPGFLPIFEGWIGSGRPAAQAVALARERTSSWLAMPATERLKMMIGEGNRGYVRRAQEYAAWMVEGGPKDPRNAVERWSAAWHDRMSRLWEMEEAVGGSPHDLGRSVYRTFQTLFGIAGQAEQFVETGARSRVTGERFEGTNGLREAVSGLEMASTRTCAPTSSLAGPVALTSLSSSPDSMRTRSPPASRWARPSASARRPSRSTATGKG